MKAARTITGEAAPAADTYGAPSRRYRLGHLGALVRYWRWRPRLATPPLGPPPMGKGW